MPGDTLSLFDEELPDRNKTPLTREVTRRVVRWLDDKGFKPVETEVPVAQGWTADISGVIRPTPSEAVRLKLIPPRPRYIEPPGSYEDQEWRNLNQKLYGIWDEQEYRPWKAEYNSLPSPLTALVEVKTSVSDFRKDRKWRLDPPTNLRFLAIPEAMIKPDELPQGWWVLCYGKRGLKLVQAGITASVSSEQKLETILSIAERRDNRTRHAAERSAHKMNRLDQAERENMVRINKAVSFVLQVRKGGLDPEDTLDRLLFFYKIKNLSGHARRQLEEMWGADRAGELRPTGTD